MFSVKVKVFTAPLVPLVGDSPRRMVLNPLPSTRPFKRARDVTALSADFSTSPSLLQGELHILTKPSLLEKGRM